MNYLIKLFLLIVMAFPILSFAQKSEPVNISKKVIEDQAPIAPSRIGKNTILNLFGNNAKEIEVILVDKALKRMYVAKLLGSDMEVIKEYPIITGKNSGDKVVRGDEKTPEGVYYVTSYTSGKDLVKMYGDYALIYGVGSYPLNYPNIVDKIRNKTGGGIWLHGTKPDLDKTFTQGCVALDNSNFLDMSKNVEIKTPVIIAENLLYSTDANFENNKKNILDVFNNFISVWVNNDAAGFKSAIHSDFRTPSGVTGKHYVSNKTNLMTIYPKKEIENFDTKIFMKDKDYVLVDTNQYYCAENISTYTHKKFYFISENGNLKLISEEVSPLSIKNVPNLDNKINDFINNWVKAWQSQKIDNYIAYYDQAFKSGKDNYNSWKTKKNDLFRSNNDISIKVSDIQWSVSGGVYKVSFIQDYSSGKIKDKGRKTILLSGCPSSFKIISEVWRSI